MRKLKSILTVVLTTVMICGIALGSYQGAFAQENNDVDSETVPGMVYQFDEKGNYNLSDTDNTCSFKKRRNQQ